jgi:hypothetical protein
MTRREKSRRVVVLERASLLRFPLASMTIFGVEG